MVLIKEEVISHLLQLVKFFKSVHCLGQSYFSAFFAENLWEKTIPLSIQSELNNANSLRNFIQLYPKIIRNECPNDFANNHPNLLAYLNTIKSISINGNEKYLKLLTDLKNLAEMKGVPLDDKIKIQTFMSPKKLHEVEVLSKMAALVSKVSESSHIVDIGGGKGYLSCLLSLNHSFKVLGLDSSTLKTCVAKNRSVKVAQIWDSVNDSEDEKPNTKATRKNFIQKYYKQTVAFVTPDTPIESLLQESFQESISNITLTGLHTCGDLASTCIRMFVKQKKIEGLLNVSCCYHLINEEFSNDDTENVDELGNYGFPLSDVLRKEKFCLGRNSRMVANQPTFRITSDLDSQFSLTSIFYRSILETIISDAKKQGFATGKVGKLAKKCTSYHDYMFKALEKVGITAQFTEKELDELYNRYEDKKQLLTAFYLLRISLGPIVESIILLDRILYLIENDISNVFLVPLFDLEISPRGFGIIAWKN